jgi:hypothetical protein
MHQLKIAEARAQLQSPWVNVDGQPGFEAAFVLASD